MIDAEGELHALDGARLCVLAGFTAAFLFDRALADEIGRGRVLIVGRLELLDAPGGVGWASGRCGRAYYSPALLLIELVAHASGELPEIALGLCIVWVEHEVLEMPEPPAKVLKALALLKKTGNLCADFPGFGQGFGVIEIAERDKRLVSLEFEIDDIGHGGWEQR